MKNIYLLRTPCYANTSGTWTAETYIATSVPEGCTVLQSHKIGDNECLCTIITTLNKYIGESNVLRVEEAESTNDLRNMIEARRVWSELKAGLSIEICEQEYTSTSIRIDNLAELKKENNL